MLKELMTIPHVVFGVFGVLFAVWVAVEAANSSERNWPRLKLASTGSAIFLWLSYLFGGWWYVVYYGVAVPNSDKSIILAGPWKWIHFFMEAKELFFMLILLSILLPIVVFRRTQSFKVGGSKVSHRNRIDNCGFGAGHGRFLVP